MLDVPAIELLLETEHFALEVLKMILSPCSALTLVLPHTGEFI